MKLKSWTTLVFILVSAPLSGFAPAIAGTTAASNPGAAATPGFAPRTSTSASELSIGSKEQAARLVVSGQFTAAETVIVKEMSKTPRDPQWITLLAEVRLHQGQVAEGLRLLQEADQLGGVTASRALEAAFAEAVLGQANLAQHEFQIAEKLDPSDPAPHYYLARLLYNRMQYEESIRESKKVIALRPNFVRAYETVGLCYEAQRNTVEAKRWYMLAIRRDEANPAKSEWPLSDMAGMLIHENRIDEARPYLERALAINPHNPQALVEMGMVEVREGELGTALKRFQAAIQANPNAEDAYYQAGRTCRQLGKTDAAMQYFDTFSKIHAKTQGNLRSWNGRDPSAY